MHGASLKWIGFETSSRLGQSKPRLLGLVVATNRGLDYGIIEPVSRIRETLDVAKSMTAAGKWTIISESGDEVTEPDVSN